MHWTRRSLIVGAAGSLAPCIAEAAGVSFPFRMLRSRPWTAIKINQRPEGHAFLIDTGSYGYAISISTAETVGLPRATKVKGRAIAGRYDAPVYTAETVTIGGALRERDVWFAGVSDAFLEGAEGILPTARYQVFSLNYDSQVATVASRLERDPEGFTGLEIEIPTPTAGSVYRLGRGSHMPVVEAGLDIRPRVLAELDGAPVRLMLDTGSDFGLFLYPDFVKKRGLWDSYSKSLPATLNTPAGLASTRLVRAKRLKLANVLLQDPVIMLGRPEDSDKDGVRITDGVIGMEYLRRLNFVSDRLGRRIWLQPNKMVGDGYRYDRAGAVLSVERESVTVAAVAGDSPAQRAGLLAGDRVTSWLGHNGVAGLGWAMQGAPGSRIELEVQRGSDTRRIGFELAERL